MSESPAANGAPVLAIDPGKDKCGVAVAQLENAAVQVLARRIILAREVEAELPALIKEFKIAIVVLGNATTSRIWLARLGTLLPETEIVVVKKAQPSKRANYTGGTTRCAAGAEYSRSRFKCRPNRLTISPPWLSRSGISRNNHELRQLWRGQFRVSRAMTGTVR